MTIYITLLRNVNNNKAHFYKISEKGVIQLRRKTPDMTNAVHSRDLQTFHIYTWVNSSKTTFRTLFFNAQLTGSEKVCRGRWFEQQWIWSIIPMPIQSTLVKARQQLGISASCRFPIIFMPNLSGPSYHLSGMHYWQQKRVNTYTIGLLLRAMVNMLRMAPLPSAGWQLWTLPYCRVCTRGWCAMMVSSRQGKSVSKEAGSRSLCGCLDLVGSRDQLHLGDSWAVEVTQSALQRHLWRVCWWGLRIW